jgi:hypothetical protein
MITPLKLTFLKHPYYMMVNLPGGPQAKFKLEFQHSIKLQAEITVIQLNNTSLSG